MDLVEETTKIIRAFIPQQTICTSSINLLDQNQEQHFQSASISICSQKEHGIDKNFQHTTCERQSAPDHDNVSFCQFTCQKCSPPKKHLVGRTVAAYIKPDEKFGFFLVNVVDFNEERNVYVVNDISDTAVSYECPPEYMIDFLRKKYEPKSTFPSQSIYALFNDELLVDPLTIVDAEAPSYKYMTTEFYPATIIESGKYDIKVKYKEGETQRIRYTDFFLKSDCHVPRKKSQIKG